MNTRSPITRKNQCGFSMLEVLVTLVIIAIALLGTAGLQAYAMRVGQSSQFRTQAVFLASDITERMEANKSAAVAGQYAIATTSTPGTTTIDCETNLCDSTALAAWDMQQWEAAIVRLLPQPTWTITQTTSGNPSTYTIVISWVDRSTDKTNHGETSSYTTTRTIGN